MSATLSHSEITEGIWVEADASFEPTLLEAALRYRFLVILVAVTFGILAYLSVGLYFNDQVAESAVLIEDPATSQLFDTSLSIQPERYLSSQAAIIESPEMAESVQSRVGEPSPLSVKEILAATTVVTRDDTDLVEISFEDSDGERAVRYANAYAASYQAYREDVTSQSFADAIAGLDESIAAVDRELAALDEDITEVTEVPGGTVLQNQLEAAVIEFLATSPEEVTADQLQTILSQVETLQLLQSFEVESPALTLLLENRRAVIDRRSQLVVRRDQLEVDAALASTGIVAVSQATEATRSTGARSMLLFGLIVGSIIGVGLAYLLAVRNRRFAHRSQPELTLGVPLLAEVPRFGAVGAVDLVPVLTEPSSPAAEAFRFASNAMVARLSQIEVQTGVDKQSIVVTSAFLGDGKTVLTINTALSAATRGKLVLIVDADFGDPALSRMLVGDTASLRGLTDIVEDKSNLSDVVIPVNLGQGHHVDVLSRGTVDIAASDFFSSESTLKFFELIKGRYDYIFIDAPPLLQVAYSSSVVRLADGVLLVIPHESQVSIQEEMVNRLNLIGSVPIGYIYNKAPARPEMLEKKGSMKDVLGTGKVSA